MSRMTQVLGLTDERRSVLSRMQGLQEQIRELQEQYARDEIQLVGIEAQLAALLGERVDANATTSDHASATASATNLGSVAAASADQDRGRSSTPLPHRAPLRNPTIADRVTSVFKADPTHLFDSEEVRQALAADGYGPAAVGTIRVNLMRLAKSNVLVNPRHGKYQWAGSVSRSQAGDVETRGTAIVTGDDHRAAVALNGDGKLNAVNDIALAGTEAVL